MLSWLVRRVVKDAWFVVVTWAVLAIVLLTASLGILGGRGLFARLEAGTLSVGGTESAQGDQIISVLSGDGRIVTLMVKDIDISSPETQAQVAEALGPAHAELASLAGATNVFDPFNVRRSLYSSAVESLSYGAGIPDAVVRMTVPVHFNDARSMEQRIIQLEEEGRKPACVIMEPAMMNLGVVLPEPDYLEAVREITERHGVVLIFDEVKTGLCIGPGGATKRSGVTPDLVTMAKALGGGLPSGAIGGTEEVMSVVEDHSVYQVGTYNGNPLVMAAVRANLEQVLTPEAYEHLDHSTTASWRAATASSRPTTCPATPSASAARAASPSPPKKVIDYETFKEHQNEALSDLAWLFNMNRGIFMTPGREEEWTLSVTHTDEAIDAYVDCFEKLAETITS